MGPALGLALLLAASSASGNRIRSSLGQRIRAPSSFGPTVRLPLLQIAPSSGAGMGTECAGTAITTVGGAAVTFTRGSAATCTKANGTIVTLTNNQPAVEGQSDGSKAIRVEPATTNVFPKSTTISAMVNTAAGPTPITVTANSTDVTDPMGGNAATKLAFTAVGAGQYAYMDYNFGGSSNNFTWSVYLRTLSGTAQVPLFMWAGANEPFKVCNVTTTWTRCILQTTLSVNHVSIGYDGSVAGMAGLGGGTVYAWGGQLEFTFDPTSLILTSGTTAARSQTQFSVANPLVAANTTYCVSAKARINSGDWTGTNYAEYAGIFGWANADGSSTRGYFDVNWHDPMFFVSDASGGYKYIRSTTIPANGEHTFKYVNTAGTLSVYLDGVATGSEVVANGTGINTVMSSTFYVGNINNQSGYTFTGLLRNFTVDNTSTGCP